MEIKIKVRISENVMLVSDFADTVKRKRSQVDKAIKDNRLDWSTVLGQKVVVINEKATAYMELCAAFDNLRSQQ